MTTMPTVKTVRLDRIKAAAIMQLPPGVRTTAEVTALEADAWADAFGQDLGTALRMIVSPAGRVHRQETAEAIVETPGNLLRWLVRACLGRGWPRVAYRPITQTTTITCPHVDLPASDPLHFAWLADPDDPRGAGVAPMAERRPRNAEVPGSSPGTRADLPTGQNP